MTKLSRRQLVQSAGALAALPIASHRALAALSREQPSLVLRNARVITIDPRQPAAEAIAIAGERIFAVGSNADIDALAAAGTKTVDLAGNAVVPGFIDAHTHPAYAGRRHLKFVDCDLRSIAAIQAAIRERAAATPPGDWVTGFKYDDTKTAGRRFLTREDLDAVAPAHPVYIVHRGGHTAYVNSLALARLGVSEKSPDPPGGGYGRDSDGRLTGRLLERATAPFEEAIPAFGTMSHDEERQSIRLISAMLARAGITSAVDAYGEPGDLRAYQAAREAGDLHTRITCMIGSDHLERMLAAGVRTGLGDEWVRVGAMKATCDGSISERTARLSRPSPVQ